MDEHEAKKGDAGVNSVWRRRFLVFRFLLVAWLLGPTAWAQRLNVDELPPSLRPWVPWVMDSVGEEACTQLSGGPACLWPGLLSLSLEETGGTFKQEVFVGARVFVTLPGGPGAWPQEVRVDGASVPVVERDGAPAVELVRGGHEIAGSFDWGRLPETLKVGVHTALVDLQVEGKVIELVKREAGSVWLNGLGANQKSGEPESVELQVYRRVRDDVAAMIDTLLVFRVAGRSREVVFDTPLLDGTVPLSVEGDLAVALEASGSLRVQVVAGRHEVRISARSVGVLHELKNKEREQPWPRQEVWTFQPNTALRSVEVSGAPGIDASRTELPQDFRTDSAYLVGPQDGLLFSTTRRGQEQVPSNRIELRREYWLDEDGSMFTVRDTVSGEMNQGFRLELEDGQLGQVVLGGDNQVITLPMEGGTGRGVEIREQKLDLVSVSRVNRKPRMVAVGWKQDVDRLSAIVRLPPGWELLTATGVDDASGTWLSRWDLFSVFYVLVMALALAKLVHPAGGILGAFALILSHGEPGSPEYLWLPLVVFATLSGVLGAGRLQAWMRRGFYGTAFVLLIAGVAFAVNQVRSSLYPHLGASYKDDFEALVATDEALMSKAKAPPAAPMEEEEVAEEHKAGAQSKSQIGGRAQESQPKRSRVIVPVPVKKKLSNDASLRRSISSYSDQKKFKADAIVQTGPGIPEATGRSWQLSWSGPVVADHSFRLFLLSPAIQKGLTFLRLLSLFVLGWFVWRKVHPPASSAGSVRTVQKAIVASSVFLLTPLLFTLPAEAQQPSDARLQELKQRLRAAPLCTPDCLSVSSLSLDLGEELKVTAEVHAATDSPYKLPGPAEIFLAPQVEVDGEPSSALRLEEDGAYYLRLNRGVHRVVLRAKLAHDRTTLDVGTAPQSVSIQAEGWSVLGVNDLRRVEGGTLTIQRKAPRRPQQNDESRGEAQVAVSPFFQVRRAIFLGVSGKVTTRIQRLSDAASPSVLRLRLLPGESLTTPGVETKDGFAIVPFPREETSRLLESSLSLPSKGSLKLELRAPESAPLTETWELSCGVVWHCNARGVVATSHMNQGHQVWTYHPWPGEKLLIEASQPASAPGSFLTVEKATLHLQPGVRMTRGELEMMVRTSRATVHSVKIPGGSKLDVVTVDGKAQAVKAEEGKVRIALGPGQRHIKVTWRENTGLSAFFRSPEVNVGAAGVNFRTTIDLPERRWLIAAGGPAQGPAILLWGYLVLIVAAAFLLPRLPFAPLSSWQWLLLGLGLTQVPSFVAIIVAGWFFAVGCRSSWPKIGRFRFNFLQLSLIGYTLVFLLVLTGSVYQGLVSSPDMDVEGAGSYRSHLVWFSDRSAGGIASTWVLSLSIWFWRAFMLAWALWLARALLTWLKWAWTEMSAGSFWMPKPVASSGRLDPARDVPDDSTV